MRMRVWSAVGVVLLLAACGSPKPELPSPDKQSKPDASGIEITGDASDPVNKLAIEAIADLEQFWGEQYPDLYDGDYQPVEGGFFAVMPSSGDAPPPCSADASELAFNAYYCPTRTSSRGMPRCCSLSSGRSTATSPSR